LIADFQKPVESVRSVFFVGKQPDPYVLDRNGILQRWNFKKALEYEGHFRVADQIRATAMNRSKGLIAVGDSKGVARIFDREQVFEICSSLRNGDSISRLKFDPSGRKLAIGGQNGVIQLWDLAGAMIKGYEFRHEGPVWNAGYSTDGSTCITAGDEGIAKIWNPSNGMQIGVDCQHSAAVMDCVYEPFGRFFVTASVDKKVKLWDSSTGLQVGSDLEHDSEVLRLAFSPDGRYIVSGCYDGSVYCWRISRDETNEHQMEFRVIEQTKKIRWVTFNHSGELIASASMDGTVACFDAKTGVLKFAAEVEGGAAFCAFFPDDESGTRKVLACGKDAATIWDPDSGKKVQELRCDGEVTSSTISSDRQRLITCESKGRTRIWKRKGGLYELDTVVQHPLLDSVYFSDVVGSNSMIAICGGRSDTRQQGPQYGVVVLWDLKENLPVTTQFFHAEMVRRVYFSPNGNEVLSVSHDGSARVWKLDQLKYSVEEISRASSLLTRFEIDEIGNLRTMPVEQYMLEFEQLRPKIPAFFSVDNSESELWANSFGGENMNE
jgi:WD40 repeat protein